MSSTLPNGLLPDDLDVMSTSVAIECLDATEFAALVPKIFSAVSECSPVHESNNGRTRPSRTKIIHLTRQRAGEASVVSAISSILTRPLTSEDELDVALTALREVVCELPEDAMLRYRQALMALSAVDPDGSCSGPRLAGSSLAAQARGAIRFMDQREDAWAPGYRDDHMAQRSLRERVHTAREMRPHVAGLLGWLRDTSWPLYTGCEAQLARFPEITMTPIRVILKQHRGDGKWINNLLRFVQDHVPVGRSWEAIYPAVNALLVIEPAGNEEACDTAGIAAGWIETLNRWRKSQEGLRCA